MVERLMSFFKVALIIGLCVAGASIIFLPKEGTPVTPSQKIVVPPDTVDSIPTFMSKTAKEGLTDALVFYGIRNPEIAYAQAVLETGHFKSVGCLKHNNLFGLYNSKTRRYYRFNHWVESVIAYKEWIQNKYNPTQDYYTFLEDIGYAEDPEYTNKLKQIVNSK